MADDSMRGPRPTEDPPEGPEEKPSDDRPEQTARQRDAAEARIAELEAELRAKAEEAAANLDRCLRAVAEAENFKKRVQRDKADAIRYGNESLVRDILPVLDNLELAVEHADLGGNGKSVVEGIQMTVRMLRDVLERHGVKAIDAASGAAFDPSVHEAAGVQATGEVEPNTVIRQDLRGYQLHDRLLRPARVVVSGPPKREDGETTE